MKKPAALRQHLLRTVPGLSKDASKLDLFVDRGRLQCGKGAGLSFRYAYTLNLVVQDYAGDPDLLMLPLLAWIAEYQPDLLARAPQEPFAYEAEILDEKRSDVSITIELTERVLVTVGPGGKPILDHLDDAPALDRFDSVDATLRALVLYDEVTPEAIPVP